MDSSDPLGLRRHFDEISAAYYDIVDKIWYDVGYYHKKEGAVLRASLKPGVNLAIDAGCGPGRHTATLASIARRVVAVDFSRKMLELAIVKVPEEQRGRVGLVQADIRHLPFKAGVADFIVNLEVLEHLPGAEKDVLRTLREFRRILGHGGILVTEAPLRRHSSWRYFFSGAPSWKEVPRDIKERYYEKSPLRVEFTYKLAEIDGLLRDVGFSKVKRRFVRVLPAGLVERFPFLNRLDQALERVPGANSFAREAIWTAEGPRSRSSSGPDSL